MTPFDMVSIDPGKRAVYAALWYGGHLQQLEKYDPEDVSAYERAPRIVIEKPNINRNTPNWQSVLDVAWSGAIVAGRCGGGIEALEPSKWKGQVVKPIHHGRILRVLYHYEKDLLPKGVEKIVEQAKERYARLGKVTQYSHDWHNYLDAIGIGLFALGRIGRGGAPGRAQP